MFKTGPIPAAFALVLAFLPLRAGLAEKPSPFTNQSRPRTVRVVMLALSSSSRQSFAGNRDVYLADLQRKDGEHEFVRLIDQYPGYGLPIRESLLRARTRFRMKATREPECDLPASQIFLNQSPQTTFNPTVQQTLQTQTQPVPCYKTLHQSIKISQEK